MGGGIALAVSLLTVLSMARLWDEAFWKPAPTMPPTRRSEPAMLAPIAVLACSPSALTVAAGPVFDVFQRAAEQLLHPDEYVARRSGRDDNMLLGNILLALAWAALQGEFSLRDSARPGHLLGYLDPAWCW